EFSIRLVVHFKSDWPSARDQLGGIRISEIQRLAAGSIHCFHGHERPFSSLAFLKPDNDIRVRSATLASDQGSTGIDPNTLTDGNKLLRGICSSHAALNCSKTDSPAL